MNEQKKGRKVALDFQGGSITSDPGVLLLSETMITDK